MQRSSGLLNRVARGSTVATHHFSWKLNRTSVPGLFRKQIVPPRGMGSMTSGFRHFYSGLAEQLMHSPCKRDQTGAAPVAGSLSDGGRDVTASIRSCEDRRAGAAPVGLPISKRARSRNRRGGGLQTRSYPVRVRARAPFRGPSSKSKTTPPERQSIRGRHFIAAYAAPCAGRSIRRSPHRHCGGRRGRTAPAHHFNDASVAQCIEHRASNAEVAGEIPAGSTTHFSRRSPTQRQRAQTSSSAGASPAAGTTLAPVAQ